MISNSLYSFGEILHGFHEKRFPLLILNFAVHTTKMVINIKMSSLIILVSSILSCKNAEQKPIQIFEKDFGLYKNENDNIAVELNLNQFSDWKKLLKRTEQIVCNDSMPKITFENDKITKRIYLRNPCWERVGSILIKQKNIIQIHNDTISKSDRFFYPLDSLKSVLKKDLENNGEIPFWSANPDKLLIFISYDTYEMERLSKTLEKVTNEHEKLTDSIILKIWLNDKFDIPLPPSLPKETKRY